MFQSSSRCATECYSVSRLKDTHAVNIIALSDICRPLCNVRKDLVACYSVLQCVAVFCRALSNVIRALSGVGVNF